MVQNGHGDQDSDCRTDVIKLGYQPAGIYPLDIEIFSVSSLIKRVSREQMQLPHQYAFGMLLFIVEGECTQWVDFTPVHCKVGSLLTLSPGQVHRYGGENHWEGWIMLLRPEFISTPGPISPHTFNVRVKEVTQNLPCHLILSAREQGIMAQSIGQMREDTELALEGDSNEINALLHHQFFTLLLRLSIAYGQNKSAREDPSTSMQRYKAFKDLVEKYHASWHQVTWYANKLGCSEKSLTRSTVQATGVTAKNIITSRINLEAKRLLVNSTAPVALIAEQLGFEEPTHFVKFFKRQAACTPGEFRRNQWEMKLS